MLLKVKFGSTHFEADTLNRGGYNGRPCIHERKMAGRGSRFHVPGTWRTVKTTIYRTTEARDAAMLALAKSAEATLKAKAERKADRAKPHTLKVGDILVSSWGYDQTNVDYYTVTATTANTVMLAPIASELAKGDPGVGPMSGYVMPVTPIKITGEAKRHRADSRGYVSLSSYSSAHLWDGRKQYCSWYA